MARLPWVLLAAVLSGSCSSAESASTARDPACTYVESGFGPAGTVPVRAEVVVTGLEVPWGLAFLPGGDLLVSERPGRVRLVRGGRLVAQPVATVANSGRDEGGLLGLAAHPEFSSNRLFYLYVTVEDGGRVENRVERWRLAPDGLAAAFDKVILGGIAAARYHDGGRIRFGPDGMLYVATGDATEPPLAQRPDSLNGKLLRVTPEGEIPKDNPVPGKAWILQGLRNVEGFDWLDGQRIAVVDHGPSGELGRRGHDEVNVARAGDNLGWPTVFGCQARDGLLAPSLAWREAVPPGGATLYTGSAIPEWKGSLLVGTLGSRHLHRVAFQPGSGRVARHEVYFQGDPPRGHGRLREVVMGPDGHLYVTTSNCDGRGTCPETRDAILRIVR